MGSCAKTDALHMYSMSKRSYAWTRSMRNSSSRLALRCPTRLRLRDRARGRAWEVLVRAQRIPLNPFAASAYIFHRLQETRLQRHRLKRITKKAELLSKNCSRSVIFPALDSPGARSSTISHQPSSYRMSRNLLPQQKRREKLPSTPRISDETPPHPWKCLYTPSLSCLAFVRVVVFLISPECQMLRKQTPPRAGGGKTAFAEGD